MDMEHSVHAQNAPAGVHEVVNIMNSHGAVTAEMRKQYPEKYITAEVGKDVSAAVHEALPLEMTSSHMNVDKSREEGGPSAETNHQTEEFPVMSEFGGKSGTSDVLQVEVDFNSTRPDIEQHQLLSWNVDCQNSPLPEQLQGEAARAEQNGSSPVGEQLSLTPLSAIDSISSPAGAAVARDTSSIPGISMLAGQSIPPAVFKHEEVVASKEVFADALNKFHTVLGTRLTKKGRGGRERAAEVKTFQESIAGIPKLGGKDLDLHLLYVEVTSRGGLEQVIKDRKLKEVTNCFKFAETITSASYVLRKYYVGLLYYFEQAYFFGKKGPLIPPPISMPGPSPMSVKKSELGLGLAPALTEGQPGFKRTRKRKILPAIQSVPVMDPAQSIGLTVRTTIEGKCEHGFLVSVTVGTEKMRGVLYHVPPMQRAPQHATIPNYAETMGAEPIFIREEPSLRGLKRKRRRSDDMPKKDPNAPRPNRTGYNFFFAEQRARLKVLHPEKDKELSRMIGDAWNSLTEEEKAPYQDRGVQDKERYKIELQEYLELLKSQNGSIPKELATELPPEDKTETLKEAVVDAAIDVAVDVAVNNAVDVSTDDVVDITTKAVTDATVGNHSLPAATSGHVAAADNTTGKADVAYATDISAFRHAMNGSHNPVPVTVDFGEGTSYTVTVASPGDTNLLDAMDDDGIANDVSSPTDGSANLLASMEVEYGTANAGSAPPTDGSANLLAAMDLDIELQQPDSVPQHPYTSQQPF